MHVLQNDESASRRISGRLIEMGSWPLNCTFHIALAKSRCTSARLRKCKVKEEEKATRETSVYVSKAKSKQTGQEREKHYRRNHNTVSGTRCNRCYFTLREQKKK
uniref:Uncharacterized protein n=1 Tax=Anopheles merus TaxID=30066 RepID=A0A182UZD4_ANOME